jgi:hypothetical protein
MPATIDDPVILQEIGAAMKENGGCVTMVFIRSARKIGRC